MKFSLIKILLLTTLVACQVKTKEPSPVVTADRFTTSIKATNNILADGHATSTVTINVKRSGTPWAGSIPTFHTSGTNNVMGACSISDAQGNSICTLKSTTAEEKTLTVVKPAESATSVKVTFLSSLPSVINSTITGTTSIIANGVAASVVTIKLKSVSNVGLPGITPTFSASGSNNVYGACTISDASGTSTCTLKSTKAEIKTLSIVTPIVDNGGAVTFIPGAVSNTTSTITGTSPVLANGVATSTISIALLDAFENPVAGHTPTFSATNSGNNNVYGICSVSNATGISQCTLASQTAETKTLSLLTPVIKTGDVVTFISGPATAANSAITGTGPVVADGTATSTISIILRDASNNPVIGETPTFGATNTNNGNIYGPCSATNISGISTCTLASTKAEIKTLAIVTPVAKTDGLVQFNAASASIANSSITGTSNIVADGTAASTVTITLKDSLNNPLIGQIPTFSATDSGNNNVYGTCSATDASGVSTCSLTSLKAEQKSLSILTPIVKVDGNVTFMAGAPVAANSSITGTSPVRANNSDISTISITLKDLNQNPVSGLTPTFSATDTDNENTYGACSATNASGVATCTLASARAETKTLSIVTPVAKSDGIVEFTPTTPSVANSTITGSGPVVANGASTSTITITLRDDSNNPIPGETPTFGATDTGSTNTYGTCSVTNSSGVSTCTLSSLKAEIKTLSIVTPISKVDGNVNFTAGPAAIANSSIAGTGPVMADGTAASNITITLKDANDNVVVGIVPTFSATDSGTNNTYGICSATDASGISTCTLSSLKAESKTLAIVTPIAKTGGIIEFTASLPVAANSTITGSGPVVANNTATSTITITLRDAGNNPVSGQIPTFTATDSGASNVYGTCSSTDASGVSTCTLKSLKAEVKTLSIATPVVKSDGTVTFTAGPAVAANSLISGTGPVIANGTASSVVSITLKDAGNNPVSGQTPTFSATNTGTTNTYGVCSVSDAMGLSTCSLRSTKAEVKTLNLLTPVIKAGTTVTFVAGAPDVAHSDITGTSPVSADGISVSFITVAMNDAFGNPVEGSTPIFNATDTNASNIYGACSATDSNGISNCTLASTRAEVKTLQMTSPIAVTGSETVTFSSTLPVAANSSITGTSPVLADGGTDSTVTITLRDINNNPVPGITPTFDATNTGSGNVYDDCSMSDASGISVCTFSSTKAETKTLRITNPVTRPGDTVIFTAGPADMARSSISGTGPVIANGVAESTITITLKDAFDNLIAGTIPTFGATNTDSTNVQTACSSSNASGVSTCTLKSTKAESKIPQILTPVVKNGTAISFIAGPAVAANSTITGTGPVNPDGTSTSTISITLKDAFSNFVSGTIPTFSATGSNNTYGVCSSSNTSGLSTCTLASTTGETKTLSISTPVSKTGGTVVFESGSAVAANSSIIGTGPVVADGVATSTITITLKDAAHAAVVGIVPEFSASGMDNTLGVCSATNSSGQSICTLASTKAEVKNLEIISPINKTGDPVLFTPGAPAAANSTIVASNPTLADGSDTCGITITIKDVNGNPISGQTPTFSMSGTNNNLSSCSITDSAGESTCTVTSTTAEEKTPQLLTPVMVNGTAVDFNPEGIDIQVPIELVDRGLSSATSAITFSRTRTTFNTADYVSELNTYMFEVIADNTNTTTSYTIYLVDNNNVQIPDSAMVIPPSTSMKRFNVIWTPNDGAADYRVKLPGTTSAGQLKVHSAKIIVDQSKAVATKIYLPLTSGEITGENATDTNSTNAQVTSVTSTTFTANNFMNLWTRNDAAYNSIAAGSSWTLETITSISNTAGTVTAALFDKTNNQQITGAQTTQTGSTALAHKTVSFAGNAVNFNDGDTLELRLKSSSTSYTGRIYKAGLWLKLKYLRSAEIFQRLAGRRSTSSSSTIADGRLYWDSGAWSNPTIYFQVNANSTSSSVSLIGHTADNGTSGGVAVSGSSITPASAYGIKRSTALSLTNLNRYYVEHTRSSGSVTLGGAFLVIKAQE